MAGKKSFIMMEDWTVLLSKLPVETAGALIKAMCVYQLTGEVVTDDPVVEAQMAVIVPIMDGNNKKHEEICQKRSEIGRQGVAKRWQKDSKQIANDSNCYTEDSKQIENALQTIAESESVSESVSESESVSVSEYPADTKTPHTPLEDADLSEPVKDKLREWLQYKKERRDAYKPRGLSALISMVHNREQEMGASAVIEAIDLSMANGWKGIIWERARSSPQRAAPDYLTMLVRGEA